jgi:hypothetical protein
MTSKEEDNNALISKIFKMVEEKSEEKALCTANPTKLEAYVILRV